MDAFLLYLPIAARVLDDLAGAADYFDELGDKEPAGATAAAAREHARRLRGASRSIAILIEHLGAASMGRES